MRHETSEAPGCSAGPGPVQNASPASVCLLRLSSLGDVTHVVPIVHALQAAWPQTSLTWIIGRREHELVGDLPGIEFIVFDKRAGWRAVQDLRAHLRGRIFDVLLHLQLSLRANLLATLVRARRRIGYDRGRAREMHRWVVQEHAPAPAAQSQHVVDAMRDFLVPLGLPRPEARWNIPVPAAARAWARTVVQGAARLLVVCPGSSRPLRNWHAGGYAAVADHAVRRYGCRVVLAGGPTPDERSLADAIRAQARVPLLDLTGRADLKQLLALLGAASVVLAPDTGPLHFANAVGTPVIGLHGTTDPRRSGPYSDLRFCVDRFAEAARRFRHRPVERLRWGAHIEEPGAMDLITVADVIAALDRFADSRAWSALDWETTGQRRVG